MKKYLISITCFCSLIQLKAQINENDSLRNALLNTKEDTARVNLLVKLAYNFLDSKPDSSLLIGEQALALSKKSGFDNGEINSLGVISNAFARAGNYSLALEKAFEEYKKSEEVHNQRQMAGSLMDIANVYSFQGDNERSLDYLLKVKDRQKSLNDEPALATTLINIGYTYYNLDRLDSARMSINQALEIALRIKHNTEIGACYLNLGMIHTKMKLYDLAKNYYQLSLPYFPGTNHYFISSIQEGLAEVLDSTKQTDSAFYYARLSFQHAKEMGSPDLIIFPSKHLVSLFKKTHQPDSALFYQDIVTDLKDTLFSQEKAKQIQALTFTEELRQMDLAKEKLKQEQDHRRNLQIAGVAIFIPLFFGVVLLMSRKQIKPRAVEFIGILFLLFVFEFITLFSHPFIGKWTHESPVLMLLIFVAVASILVPLHHRSEKWLQQQLVLQRNKALKRRIELGLEAKKELES
jgi:tetratricopeptide (TPR) repeat protein